MRPITSHGLPLSIHQEFGEVPLDVSTQHFSLSILEEAVQRSLILAVDIDLGEEREGVWALVLCKGLHFSVAARLLSTKLVAREGQHLKAAGFVFPIELTQFSVV